MMNVLGCHLDVTTTTCHDGVMEFCRNATMKVGCEVTRTGIARACIRCQVYTRVLENTLMTVPCQQQIPASQCTASTWRPVRCVCVCVCVCVGPGRGGHSELESAWASLMMVPQHRFERRVQPSSTSRALARTYTAHMLVSTERTRHHLKAAE